MVDVKLGVPASTLDQFVFLGGVLIDPVDITYEMKEPGGSIGTDEDGVPISGRKPIQTGLGHFHAGNTILIDDTKIGVWTIEWTIKKLTASTPIVKAFPFALVKEVIEDPTIECVTRRDIEDTVNLDDFRILIGDSNADDTKWAFFNSELQSILTKAIAKHTDDKATEATATTGELAQSMTLAHATVMHRLATDKRRFFKWRDGSESVDKSMQPVNCIKIADSLLDQYVKIERLKLDEKKETGFSSVAAGDLLNFRGGRRRRR